MLRGIKTIFKIVLITTVFSCSNETQNRITNTNNHPDFLNQFETIKFKGDNEILKVIEKNGFYYCERRFSKHSNKNICCRIEIIKKSNNEIVDSFLVPEELTITSFYPEDTKNIYFIRPTTGELYLFKTENQEISKIGHYPMYTQIQYVKNNLIILGSLEGFMIIKLPELKTSIIKHRSNVPFNSQMEMLFDSGHLYVSGLLDNSVKTGKKLVCYQIDELPNSKWEVPISNEYSHHLEVHNNRLYSLTSPFNKAGSTLKCLNLNGKVLNSINQERRHSGFLSFKDCIVYFSHYSIKCVSLNLENKFWEIPRTDFYPEVRVFKISDELYIYDTKRFTVEKINKKTGEVSNSYFLNPTGVDTRNNMFRVGKEIIVSPK